MDKALIELLGGDADFRAEIQSGDKRRALVAIRDVLAWKLDSGVCATCGGPRGETAGMASIAKQILEVVRELDGIPDDAEVTFLDSIRQRHDSRMPDAEQGGTARKSQARKQGGRKPGAGRRAGPGPLAGDAAGGDTG